MKTTFYTSPCNKNFWRTSRSKAFSYTRVDGDDRVNVQNVHFLVIFCFPVSWQWESLLQLDAL